DVVAGPVLADEIGLQHQRLELVVGDDVLEGGDLADERVRLGVSRARLVEVRAHTAAQRGGLAHVDRLRLAVFVERDRRSFGQARELVFEGWCAHNGFIVAGTARSGKDVGGLIEARVAPICPVYSRAVDPRWLSSPVGGAGPGSDRGVRPRARNPAAA